jgi:hypothetical protein
MILVWGLQIAWPGPYPPLVLHADMDLEEGIPRTLVGMLGALSDDDAYRSHSALQNQLGRYAVLRKTGD